MVDLKLIVKLKYIKKICDEVFKVFVFNEEDFFEINVNVLEGVVKGCYVLLFVVDIFYKWFIEGDSSYIKDFDVEREVGCLLGFVRKFCIEGFSIIL